MDLASAPARVVALPGPRRHAHHALEHTGEVTLFRKPRDECDLGEIHCVREEQLLRLGDARIELPAMGAYSRRHFERSAELGLRQARERREIAESNGVAEVVENVLGDA